MALCRRGIFIVNGTPVLFCRRVGVKHSIFTLRISRHSSSTDESDEDYSGAMLGVKAKNRRFMRNLKLRKNRQDVQLEKDARTGNCKLV